MTFSPVQYLEKIKQNHVSYLYVIYTAGQSVVSKQKDEMEKNERRAATARLLKMEKGNSKTFHIWEMGNEIPKTPCCRGISPIPTSRVGCA